MLMDRMTSEAIPAQGDFGRATHAAGRTAGEVLTGVGLNAARQAGEGIFTSAAKGMAGRALVAREVGGGVRGLADVAHAVGTGASGERIQENAVNGEYGFTAQGATMLLARLTGDDAVLNQSINAAAERGERGHVLRFANYLGNSAFEAAEAQERSRAGIHRAAEALVSAAGADLTPERRAVRDALEAHYKKQGF
jgi:hypothetical protein